jgi:predicted HD superfamily hydrolase involved in NAD metabolism
VNDVEERLRGALARLPHELTEHVFRVVDEALRLADAHGIDAEAVRIATLGHDLLRAHGDERLLRIAEEQAYAMDPVDRIEPILLHGPLAVAILREQYGVVDADVLGAVAAHTTAAPRMTRLQKLLFVADKIEPEKVGRKAPVERVRDLAPHDLDAAMRAYLDFQIVEALERGWAIHPNTIAARNELIAAERGQASGK